MGEFALAGKAVGECLWSGCWSVEGGVWCCCAGQLVGHGLEVLVPVSVLVLLLCGWGCAVVFYVYCCKKRSVEQTDDNERRIERLYGRRNRRKQHLPLAPMKRPILHI